MRKRALLFLLLSLFLIGNTVGVYALLTAQREFHVWDFQPLWQAGRWIVEGRGDPYSGEMTRFLQIQSYGRLAEESEDPHVFAYPLYVLLLLGPLFLLPLPWAQAVWFTLLELGVVVGVIGTVRLAGWRPSTHRTLFTVMWGFFLYPVAWALLLGQVSILIFALMVVALLALRTGREGWAGVFLALMTAKPQMSFLLVPALLLWALGQRRYRFLGFFAGTMGTLLLGAFLVLPGWLAGVLGAGVRYFEVQPFPPPVAMLGETIAGERSEAVTLALVILLLAGVAWAWWRQRASGFLPMWPIGLTLVVTTLIAPRTSVVNQVLLLLPLCLLLADLDRWGQRGGLLLLAAVIQVALLFGLWAVDLLCLPPWNSGEHVHAQQQVISPILPTLLLLVLAGRPWWVRRGGGQSLSGGRKA